MKNKQQKYATLLIQFAYLEQKRYKYFKVEKINSHADEIDN